jgi:hypothetical protein
MSTDSLSKWFIRGIALALILVGSPVLRAAIPDGSFFFGPFNGTYTSIYDVSGTYEIEESIPQDEDPPLDLSFDVTLMQDAKGKITGTGMTMIEFEEQGVELDEVPAFYEVKGKVKTSADQTYIDIQIKAYGSGSLLGIVQDYKVQIKIKSLIEPANDRFIGITKGTAKASELGTAKLNSFVVQDLPSGMDGSWFMDMFVAPVTPDGNKIEGTSEIRLSNGVMLPFTLKGKYVDKWDEAKIKLTGVDAALGAKVNRIITGASGAALLAYKGKILGQKIEWEVVFP